MKILIVDRDDVAAHLIKSRLEPLGHTVEIRTDKSDLDEVMRTGWDVVFIDPSPLTTVQPMAMQLRRAARSNLYMVLLSNTLELKDAVEAGFNDLMAKPLDPQKVEKIVDRAEYMNALLKHLSNDEIDFPSAGGVIAKSAYNQLFLSCIDRAGRYGETAHTIFISIANYKDIAAKDGSYDAELISAKLAQHLVRIRRQSDIIAQVRDNEYALLLLRPMSETEPMEAAGRFAEALGKCKDLPTTPYMDVEVVVTLLGLPQGDKVAEYKMVLQQD